MAVWRQLIPEQEALTMRFSQPSREGVGRYYAKGITAMFRAVHQLLWLASSFVVQRAAVQLDYSFAIADDLQGPTQMPPRPSCAVCLPFLSQSQQVSRTFLCCLGHLTRLQLAVNPSVILCSFSDCNA